MKNIIIVVIVVVGAALVWGASVWFVPQKTLLSQPEADISQTGEIVTGTSTQEVIPSATSSESVAGKKQETNIPGQKEPARITLTKTQFPYDIVIGKTPCGDTIGSFDVVSTDPKKMLYWGMTGAMPLWLTFSAVEGKTPATVDMSFNCILSGAEEKIDWGFVVVEKTAEGKYVDGYYRSFKIEGDIVRE
ncbi:hypothetical protein HY839_01630 [Candidatus Azambacteria bacterium]|nr:hypothetical protein [Candidatus Azambacteria bacterium]